MCYSQTLISKQAECQKDVPNPEMLENVPYHEIRS